MQSHIRGVIAAASHAVVTGKKVAGLYDHAAGRHLRIAAEARGKRLQGHDGDRDATFGGTLPELRDAADGASLHIVVEGDEVRGYDRSSSRGTSLQRYPNGLCNFTIMPKAHSSRSTCGSFERMLVRSY